MNIKSRLFGKPWQHRDETTRAAAVAGSNDPELRAELGRIAEHDASAVVRLAALKRIDTEAFWLDARLRESDAGIIAAADSFLFKAVLQRPGGRLIEERLEWLQRIDDESFVRRAAAQAPDRALRAAALERISAPGFLGDRVVEEADDELAIAQIGRIDQQSTLERILTSLRRVSKRRAQAVADRLRQLQAASGEYDAAAESAARLVERAENLARGQFTGNRLAERDQIKTQWDRLEHPPEPLARRFDGALGIVDRALAAINRGPAAAAPPDDAGQDAPQAADAALSRLVRQLEAIADINRLDAEEVRALLTDFDRNWQRIGQPGPAEEALRERALPVLRALQQRHQRTLERQSAAASTAGGEHAAIDWQRELDAAAALIDSGDTAGAHDRLRQLRSRLDRRPPRQRPRAGAARLRRLEGRLRELRNWEHWSNNQRRDELIERVEQLAGSGQHPDAITATLKEARGEWQRLEELEVLPGDKRRYAAPARQWRRFQTACREAFGQARPFFEKRAEVQTENLEQLEAFLERAGQATADDSGDIDRLKRFQRGARLAIRRLDDLPPKSRGRAAGRLRELMDQLSQRLDSAFETIEISKRGLIREALALAHEADLKTAADKAKALQARWQKLGSGRRRVEQQLWQEFRAPIDPIFEKLQGESDQRRAARKAEIAALRELLDQAEALARCSEDELGSAEGRMRALRSQWDGAGQRPGNLSERFEQAERALTRRLHERDRAARRQAQEQLDELAALVQSAWQARLAGKMPGFELPQAAPENDRARALLDTARTLFDPAIDIDRLAAQIDANGARARQILIELEFLAGLDSPPEDQQARMNFQVQRLARRMSERDQTPGLAAELAQLNARWYAAFPQPVDQHQSMAKRFQKCQNAFESMSGTE